MSLNKKFPRLLPSAIGKGWKVTDLVDNSFKAYNDSYGHPAGDECLRRIAQVIRAYGRRAGDLPARLGGEEFALLLPDLDPPLAESLAESLDRTG